jgi:hypothetical protein
MMLSVRNRITTVLRAAVAPPLRGTAEILDRVATQMRLLYEPDTLRPRSNFDFHVMLNWVEMLEKMAYRSPAMVNPEEDIYPSKTFWDVIDALYEAASNGDLTPVERQETIERFHLDVPGRLLAFFRVAAAAGAMASLMWAAGAPADDTEIMTLWCMYRSMYHDGQRYDPDEWVWEQIQFDNTEYGQRLRRMGFWDPGSPRRRNERDASPSPLHYFRIPC